MLILIPNQCCLDPIFEKKTPVLDPNQEFQNSSSLNEHPVLIIGMEGFYFDTQESEFELVGYTKPTKAPWKDKNPRCIVDFMHLSSMTTSYNLHFMFYNQDKSSVT